MKYKRISEENVDITEVTKQTTLAADYYINREVGFGVSYEQEKTDAELGGGKTLSINVTADIGSGFTLVGSIEKYTADSDSSDSTFSIVGASYKF